MVSWNKSLSVGIEEIDDQHKYFIGLVNKADSLIRDGVTKEEQLKVAKELGAYAQKHFETEEKYMQKMNYPFLEEHKAEHRKLVLEAEAFYLEISLGQKNIAELCIFLWKWLENHLKTHDMKYAEFFKNKNKKQKKN